MTRPARAFIMVGLLAVDPSARQGARFAAVVLGGGVDVLLLAGWLFVFTPTWVRTPAEAYADRLLETCETLSLLMNARDTHQRPGQGHRASACYSITWSARRSNV